MKRKISSVLYMALPIILVILFLGGWLFHYYNANKTPILRVITEPSGSWTLFREDEYYNVYQSGRLEEIDQFSISEVEQYYLWAITDDVKQGLISKGDEVSKTILDIVELTKKQELAYLANKLFIINGRYFYDVYDQKNKVQLIVEYNPKNGNTHVIARFDGVIIKHIELYSNQ